MATINCIINDFFNVQKISSQTVHSGEVKRLCLLFLLDGVYKGDLSIFVTEEDKKCFDIIKEKLFPSLVL